MIKFMHLLCFMNDICFLFLFDQLMRKKLVLSLLLTPGKLGSFLKRGSTGHNWPSDRRVKKQWTLSPRNTKYTLSSLSFHCFSEQGPSYLEKLKITYFCIINCKKKNPQKQRSDSKSGNWGNWPKYTQVHKMPGGGEWEIERINFFVLKLEKNYFLITNHWDDYLFLIRGWNWHQCTSVHKMPLKRKTKREMERENLIHQY